MILHSIELNHVGTFRRGASIGPLGTGVNILSAPNERGKSTFLHAAARALFDKHTCKDDEIRSLQPAGTDLSPTVVVVLESGGIRYKVHKRFLNNPLSEISEWRNNSWQLLDEADKADERLQKLLQSSVPGRGATKAAHWGLLNYLWARQGQICEWPNWEGDAGQRIQAHLAKVEIDPVIQKIKEELWSDYSLLFTPNGKSKKGGDLERLETEWVRIASQLDAIRISKAELDELERRYCAIPPELGRLEAELQERQAGIKELQQQLNSSEKLTAELKARETELQVATDKLTIIERNAEKLRQCQAEFEEAKDEVTKLTETHQNLLKAQSLAREQVRVLETEVAEGLQELEAANGRSQRIAALQRLIRLQSDLEADQQLAKKISERSIAIATFSAAMEKLPNITPGKVKKWRELSDQIREYRSKLDALGLTIEIKADQASTVAAVVDGKSTEIAAKPNTVHTFHSGQSAELKILGWGEVTIRSGSMEVQQLREQFDECSQDLREQLIQSGVASVEEAEQAVARRKELQIELKHEESTLQSLLGKQTAEELLQRVRQLATQIDALRRTVNPADGELVAATELDTEYEKLSILMKGLRLRSDVSAKELSKSRQKAEAIADQLKDCEVGMARGRATAISLEQKISDLSALYPNGVEEAKRVAQTEFVSAEARRDTVKAALPPDFDKLPDRNRRAALALQETELQVGRLRKEQDTLSGSLQTLGAQGLYSKESELLERQEYLRPQIDRLRISAWGARLVHDLIECRKDAATRSVLGPIENRLSSAFAEITKDPDRRVFLDEKLQIRGVGTREDALVRYENLSQGAKEQLLLCLRLAVATEVASSGHRLVILDDVLVNTDGLRQQRVLDLLQAVAGTLQILVLTCHPQNYRGVGEVVEIREVLE